MLASPVDFAHLQWPVYASPKLDGIRAVVRASQLVSRKLLQIPNRHVYTMLSAPELNGVDGELIVGEPTAHNVYTTTSSAVMGHSGEPQFKFYAFDDVDYLGRFAERLEALRTRVQGLGHPNIIVHEHVLVNSYDHLLAYESQCIEAGYEGLILRSPGGLYKHGRSTAREQYMLKLKRFEDSEAEILSVVEEMHNTNAAEKDNLGRTKRSKAQAGLVGKGTMGALKVRDIHTGVEFEIGTGFTAADRARMDWSGIVKYKFFPVGVKDKPRHPVYLGMRHAQDMS